MMADIIDETTVGTKKEITNNLYDSINLLTYEGLSKNSWTFFVA
jgi:hypothetical protein